MKLVALFCGLSVLIVCGHCAFIEKFKSNPSNYFNLADATKAAILDYTSVYATAASIITHNDSSAEVGAFVNRLLEVFAANPLAVFRLIDSLGIPSYADERIRFSITVIRSFREFSDIFRAIPQKKFSFRGSFIVVLVNHAIEIQDIFKLMWKLQAYHVNVIFDDGTGKVLVKSFIPFDDDKCNETSPILINSFENGSFVIGSENFFPVKTRNLHNCQINVLVSNAAEPSIIVERFSNGTNSFSGSDINIVRTIAENLNFSINFTVVGREALFFEDESTMSISSAMVGGEIDFSISDWYLTVDRMKDLETTISYSSDKLILVIPFGVSLTSFEKMILPFESVVWMMVTLVFIIGFLVIFVVNRKAERIRKFVFGSGIKHPCLNMINAFLGGAIKSLPKTNFARFLLMIFLMYSLIIRTIYQASYYKILKTSKNEKEIQSIEELNERDFKLYLYSKSTDLRFALDTTSFNKIRFVVKHPAAS